MTRTIVVPLTGPVLDPNRTSEQALPMARELAERTGGAVVLVSVVDTYLELGSLPAAELNDPETLEQHSAERYQYLNKVAASFPEGRVRTEVRIGEPDIEILALTQTQENPIIVMASHGRWGIKRLIVGSTAFECIQRSSSPVIVVPVRRGGIPDRAPVLDRVLMLLDGSKTGERALEATLQALDFSPMDLRLVRVLIDSAVALPGRPDREETASREATERYLEEIANRVAPRVENVSWQVRLGEPDRELVKAAREHESDVIALATRGRTGIRGLIFGSLAEDLIRESHIPLLLVGPGLGPVVETTTDEADTARTFKVRDIMTIPAITVPESATLEEVARVLLRHDVGGVSVVDEEGRLRGIITESDFTGKERNVPFAAYKLPELFGEWLSDEGVERIYSAGRELTAGEVMSKDLITATEDEPVTDAVERLVKFDLNRMPVVRDGVPVGMITRHDLLKLLTAETRPIREAAPSNPSPAPDEDAQT